MKSVLFAIVSFSLLAVFAEASTHHADYYEQGKTEGAKLYTSTNVTEGKDGVDISTITYKDPDGNVVGEEKYWLNGSKITRAEIQQKQTGQSAVIEVKDGRVYFEKTEDGKTKKSDERQEDTFVMSGNFQRFVKDHWADLSEGHKVEFRFGVWDRRETVGFELSKIGDSESQGQKTITLKMRPSSFLIAALVKPLEFRFAADGSHLLQSSGRIAPKKKSGSGWKDLDAETVYTYDDEPAKSH